MNKVTNYTIKSKPVYIGLEDSKRTWKLCIRYNGREIRSTSMPAAWPVLRSFLNNNFENCQIHLIYEAGFRGFNLHDRLTEVGIDCVVIPPHLVTEPKVNMVKTDRRDAKQLAKILETGDYRPCHIPDKERREDRQISHTLIAVQKEIVATKNRIRKMLDFHGIELHYPEGYWSQQFYCELKGLKLSHSLYFTFNIMIQHLEQLVEMRNQFRKKLRELTKKQRYKQTFRIIKSVPGIGWFTAIRLVLEWGEDLSRFIHSNQIASYVGLVSRRIFNWRYRPPRTNNRTRTGFCQNMADRMRLGCHPYGSRITRQIQPCFEKYWEQEEGHCCCRPNYGR